MAVTPQAAPKAILPMIVTRAGLALMSLVDVLLLARHSAVDLAAFGLVEGTFGRLLDICVAAVLSALPVAGAAFAERGRAGIVPVWHRSMATALLGGALLTLPALFALPLLAAMGHAGPLAAKAAGLVPIVATGAMAGLLAMACAVMLEGMGRAVSVAWAVIVANIANLALNTVLIGGAGVIAPMGATGSALGTASIRAALLLVLLGTVLKTLKGAADARATPRERALHAVRQWHACLAATAIAATMHCFGLGLTTIAGWQGGTALALYTACWAINLPAMILVSGLGDALSLQAARLPHLSLAALLRWPIVTVGAAAALLFAAAPLVAAAYGLPTPLQRALASLLPLSFLVLGVDAASLLVMSALRGRQMFVAPALAQIGSMALAVPAAWWLAVGNDRPLGITGMVMAILATSLVKLGVLAVIAITRRSRTLMPSVRPVSV